MLLQYTRASHKSYHILDFISDGINVEIVSGLTEEDNVKQWNKTEPIKKGTEEDGEEGDSAE